MLQKLLPSRSSRNTKSLVRRSVGHPQTGQARGRNEGSLAVADRELTGDEKHIIRGVRRPKMLARAANSTELQVLVFVTLAAAIAVAQDVLPRPEPPFKGHVGPTVQD